MTIHFPPLILAYLFILLICYRRDHYFLPFFKRSYRLRVSPGDTIFFYPPHTAIPHHKHCRCFITIASLRSTPQPPTFDSYLSLLFHLHYYSWTSGPSSIYYISPATSTRSPSCVPRSTSQYQFHLIWLFVLSIFFFLHTSRKSAAIFYISEEGLSNPPRAACMLVLAYGGNKLVFNVTDVHRGGRWRYSVAWFHHITQNSK